MSFRAESVSNTTSGQGSCAWSGCGLAGEYRAPADKGLRSYVMFCLDHVRAYNASWDYHKGFTTTELEAEIRSAATWERPTWKLGTLGGGSRGGMKGSRFKVNDPFGFAAGTAFDPEGEYRGHGQGSDSRRPRDESERVHAARVEALQVMQLTWPVTPEGLKQRYKALVKKHHPDANGGSADAENRMKVINQAYQILRAELVPAP